VFFFIFYFFIFGLLVEKCVLIWLKSEKNFEFFVSGFFGESDLLIFLIFLVKKKKEKRKGLANEQGPSPFEMKFIALVKI